MTFFTYILKSKVTNKHYYGYCSDLEIRLADHSGGKVKYTKPFRPWYIHYFEEFDSKTEAIKRGNFFKSID